MPPLGTRVSTPRDGVTAPRSHHGMGEMCIEHDLLPANANLLHQPFSMRAQ
jgi:hypothetical protein